MENKIMIGGCKVYIKQNTAYIFPPFGRVYRVTSSTNILDYVTDFLCNNNRCANKPTVTFATYSGSLEDTAVIIQNGQDAA